MSTVQSATRTRAQATQGALGGAKITCSPTWEWQEFKIRCHRNVVFLICVGFDTMTPQRISYLTEIETRPQGGGVSSYCEFNKNIEEASRWSAPAIWYSSESKGVAKELHSHSRETISQVPAAGLKRLLKTKAELIENCTSGRNVRYFLNFHPKFLF